MRKSVIRKRRPLEDMASVFDAELARRAVPDSGSFQPSSPLQGSERDSYEHLVGLLKAGEPCQDIIAYTDALAFLNASGVVSCTSVLMRVCARFGEEAGPVAEMLALFYCGLSDMGADGIEFSLKLHSAAGDRAIFVIYLFLKRWQDRYYAFENYADIGRQLVEMQDRLQSADHSVSQALPARSI